MNLSLLLAKFSVLRVNLQQIWYVLESVCWGCCLYLTCLYWKIQYFVRCLHRLLHLWISNLSIFEISIMSVSYNTSLNICSRAWSHQYGRYWFQTSASLFTAGSYIVYPILNSISFFIPPPHLVIYFSLISGWQKSHISTMLFYCILNYSHSLKTLSVVSQ